MRYAKLQGWLRDRTPNRRVLSAGAGVVLGVLVVAPVQGADTAQPFKPGQTPAGIPFYWRHDATTPFAAINFGMRDIYGLTTRGKEGLSALGGSLVMQGADAAGQNEFTERLKDLAASASFSIGPFTTTGSVRAPSATLGDAMALLAGAVKSAAPTDKILSRIKQRAEGGEAQAVTRAETIAERAALRMALGDHPITRSQDPHRFARITLDDIATWRRFNLDRSRLRIAASGRIEQALAARIIDDAFASVPTGLAPQRFEWPGIDVPVATIVVETDTAQSAVLLVGPTKISGGREVETGNIANAVLGGGANSRLWQAARGGLGATYGASSGFMQVGPSRRLLMMRAAVANDQVKASLDTLRTAYSTWRKAGVTPAELSSTRSRFLNDIRSAFDEPARANGMVLGMLLANRALEDLYTYDQRLAALGRDSVNQFIAQKFPAPEELLTIIVTPKAEGLDASCVVRALEEIDRCKSK